MRGGRLVCTWRHFGQQVYDLYTHIHTRCESVLVTICFQICYLLMYISHIWDGVDNHSLPAVSQLCRCDGWDLEWVYAPDTTLDARVVICQSALQEDMGPVVISIPASLMHASANLGIWSGSLFYFWGIWISYEFEVHLVSLHIEEHWRWMHFEMDQWHSGIFHS